MLQLIDVSKTYDNGFQALSGINLSIKTGEIFGLIGSSGAGKSTLLRCFNLLERPSQGKVLVGGDDLCPMTPNQLRLARFKFGIIFQQFNLLANKTVYQNIALPMRIQGKPREEIGKKIPELLDLVGLSDKAHYYPAKLSGGQKQRVAIARALSCEPNYLLCDEATSALDPHTTHAILDLLKTINRRYGISIVLITHEMDVIKQICQRLAVIEGGRIIECLATKEVFSQPNKSPAKQLLSTQLTPRLPDYLIETIQAARDNESMSYVRIFFYDLSASEPLISRISRDLAIDINILQANIDAIEKTSFGVLVVELRANAEKLEQFYQYCAKANVSVEVLDHV